jgi:putative ABC transport system ATP-binding protein
MSKQSVSLKVTPDAENVNAPMLSLRGVGKTYESGGHPLAVLRGVDLDVAAGARCAIVGPSGSGKTTLLGLCAGLDRPSEGTIQLAGHDLSTMDQDGLAELRNAQVGFVFQSFQLLPSLTALENVLVPLELQGGLDVRSEAEARLADVGLRERMHHYPSQLSGGEQQRVALARAFVHRPKILFADEPTGNLDAETSQPIEQMLFSLNENFGTALVLVTHDPELAQRVGRVVQMRGGLIESDTQL